MVREDDFGFDVQEWYLRHDGTSWGPVDRDTLTSLVSQGRITGSTLVRLGGDDAWRRLDEVAPDWELREYPAPSPLPEFDEPALHVFRPRAWVCATREVLTVAPLFLIVMLVMGGVDYRMLAAYSAAIFVGAFLRGLGERVEVSAHLVRRVTNRRPAPPIRIGEIDPTSSPRRGLGAVTGDWVVRSASGRSIWLNWRDYSVDDVRELQSLLGLDAA